MNSTLATATVKRGKKRDLVAQGDLPPLKHFIDGTFNPDTATVTTKIVNPADGSLICEVPEGTTKDVDRAVEAAKRAQPTWGKITPQERSEVLHRIADRVEEHADLLARIESLNTGKPLATSQDDIAGTVDTFRFMAGSLRAQTSMAAGEYVEGHTSIILREPVGVVGAITPWNYPLLMAAWKIAPILAAGNSLVLKPSEQTPLTTLKFVEIISDLLPEGVLNIVTGLGPTVGTRLAEHPEIDLVALTGSVRSGKSVATAAGATVKRVHLELGGKAPVVIFPDADLAAAAQSLREASFWNSGQECGAACRVLVHESVYEEFTELLVEQVRSFIIGDPLAGEDVEIGPMISEAHFHRVSGFLKRAREQGIPAAIGGAPLDGPGFFIAPTVLTDVPAGSEVSQEEIFGPVVTVETFTDENEAISRANEVDYGLAASVWTNDTARSLDVTKKLHFGTVWVNSHLVLANEVPWGGFKGSGYGRDLSIYALDDFSRTKHAMLNHTR